MIFVTVGSLLPFDRLIRWMDDWARDHPERQVFAQTGMGEYQPAHMAFSRELTPRDFTARVREAEVFVAHAGMGSVLTALEMGKPVVIVPRLQAQREHTTNHQVDTAGWLAGRPGVFVAQTPQELAAAIATVEAQGLIPGETLPAKAPAAFTDRIRAFLAG